MKAAEIEKIWTDDQLLALHDDGRKHELWDGKVITMPPAGAEHGDVIARLLAAIATHAYEGKLGRVYDGQTGFRLSVDFCFEPDISFVSRQRLKLILPVKEKMFHGAPDLAVEVLSPRDSITRTEKKITLYLTHGTRMAWIVDPRNRWVRAYRGADTFELLRPGRVLSGNSILPGFRYPVARLFENPSFD